MPVHQEIIKLEAIKLRKAGYPYSFISNRTKVAKSTLSGWLKGIKYQPNSYFFKRIKNARIKTAKAKREKRELEKAKIRKKAKMELSTLTKKELKIAGAALYWGDGRKHDGMVGLVNSDPKIIKFFFKWLREVCNVPQENIRMEIHLYPDSDLEYLTEFWVNVTGIPEKQFLSPQVDRRKDKKPGKKGKLPYGTAHVYVYSGKDGKYGYRLYEKIRGWMNGIAQER